MGKSVHLVITNEMGDIFNVEVEASEVIENLKAIVEVEVLMTW